MARPHRGRALGRDDVHPRREDPRQPEHVLAGAGRRLVEGVDRDDDPLAGLAAVGGAAQQLAQEVRPRGSGLGQHSGARGVGLRDLVGADQLRGEVELRRQDACLARRELAEVVDQPARFDEVRDERALAQAGLRLDQEVAAVVALEEVIEQRDEPLAAHELLDVHAVEDLAGLDVGLRKALVGAFEERVVVARDDQPSQDVTSGGDTAMVGLDLGGLAHQRPVLMPPSLTVILPPAATPPWSACTIITAPLSAITPACLPCSSNRETSSASAASSASSFLSCS
jgi:hypothetical protein